MFGLVIVHNQVIAKQFWDSGANNCQFYILYIYIYDIHCAFQLTNWGTLTNHWQARFLCNSGCILNIIFQSQSIKALTFIVIKASTHPINDQLLQKSHCTDKCQHWLGWYEADWHTADLDDMHTTGWHFSVWCDTWVHPSSATCPWRSSSSHTQPEASFIGTNAKWWGDFNDKSKIYLIQMLRASSLKLMSSHVKP